VTNDCLDLFVAYAIIRKDQGWLGDDEAGPVATTRLR
jgi:hypothetical protein